MEYFFDIHGSNIYLMVQSLSNWCENSKKSRLVATRNEESMDS